MRSRFLLAMAAVAALATPALADDAACDYVEIAATNAKDASLDPELKPLEKKLTKKPFTGWNAFKKLAGGSAGLATNKPHTLKLAQGSASLMLRDRSAKRVELTVTMENAAGKRILDVKQGVKAGDWLLLVGTDSKDDGHILGVTCR